MDKITKKTVNNNVKIDGIKSLDMIDNNQTFADIEQKTDTFIACNDRLDKIIKERLDLVLGEWISWNEMYEKIEEEYGKAKDQADEG